MKASKIREMSTDELSVELNNLRDQLFHLRMDLVLGQLENAKKIRHNRRDIARILTILGERQRAETREASH